MSCDHKMISHAFPNGETWQRCTLCGININTNSGTVTFDKRKRTPPPTYLKRNTNARDKNGYCNWESCGWNQSHNVNSFADAEKRIKEWNSQSVMAQSPFEFQLPLHCQRCYHVCNETYPSNLDKGLHLCYSCSKEETESMPKKKSHKTFWGDVSVPTKAGFATTVFMNQAAAKDTLAKVAKPTLVRKEGDIWAMSANHTPFGSQQWGYLGSAKTPYVITHYPTKRDGSVTDDGWACSCPNFTKKAVRTPCKHILNVMLKQGLGVKASAAKMANVDDKKLAAFEKWEREQAAAKKTEANPTAGATLALFGATKRKFR